MLNMAKAIHRAILELKRNGVSVTTDAVDYAQNALANWMENPPKGSVQQNAVNFVRYTLAQYMRNRALYDGSI